MNNTVEVISHWRLIAVIRLETYEAAVPIARALVAGGVRIIEWTRTGTGVEQAIYATREALGDLVRVGVGTVLDPTEADSAIVAGAQFVVTPTVRPQVVARCRERSTPVLCGALTPTEAMAAHEAGADMVKIFPARAVGPQHIRDLLGPLPMLRLVPTGGIDAGSLRGYLDAGAAAVGIGGNLVSPAAVTAGAWDTITAAAAACARAAGLEGTKL